jgi:hypothetical protein
MNRARTISTFLAVFVLILGLSSSAAFAQDLEGGLVFGSDTDLGVKLGAYFPVSETIKVGGDFTYFFPDGFDFYEVNVNGRYPIPIESSIDLSAFAGLNYSNSSVDGCSDVTNAIGVDVDCSDSDIGLNLGGRAGFGEGPLGFYADIKFVMGGADQLVIGGGVSFAL